MISDEHGMGRLVVKDLRDANYPMVPLGIGTKLPTSKYWGQNSWKGNQGTTSQCTAYAWVHWLEDGPITHNEVPPPMINPTVLYEESRRVDDFPGEDYDGTTVRAGAKILQTMGWILSYQWTTDVNVLVNTILQRGPVVLGTWWFDSMFNPNKKGIISIAGLAIGGHAYVCNGVNTKTQLLRIKNSWGTSWGIDGSAYISFNDMAKLLSMDGECCLGVENKKRIIA